MSSTFWAEYLAKNEAVISDEEDKPMMTKYEEVLNGICLEHGWLEFSEIIAYDGGVDLFFGDDDSELDDELRELKEKVMAEPDFWLPLDEVVHMLESLYAQVQKSEGVEILAEDKQGLLEELQQTVDFAKTAKKEGSSHFRLQCIY